MTGTTVGLAALLAFVGASSVLAQTGDTDWRSYGVTQDGKEAMFFDAAGVVRWPDGHVEVWTKQLSQDDMVRAANAKSTRPKILALAQQILARRPQPETADDPNAQNGVAVMEAAADVGDIQPLSRALFELDCVNRRARPLSVYGVFHGKRLDPSVAGHWAPIPPETAVAYLLKVLCTQH
jgi:hypothetical protein